MSIEKTASKTTSRGASVDRIRYVLDFGPLGAQADDALKSIDGWLSNASKYSGAIMIRPSQLPEPPADKRVTAVEIELKLYEVPDLNDELVRFVLGVKTSTAAASVSEPARLVLSETTRTMVSEVVRSALAYALGESGRGVVLSKLQLDYGFGFSEVTDFPGRFMELLNEILGAGSKYVEDRILQELTKKSQELSNCVSFKEAVIKLVEIDSLQQK